METFSHRIVIGQRIHIIGLVNEANSLRLLVGRSQLRMPFKALPYFRKEII